MYGTQTLGLQADGIVGFENDVNMYGTQTVQNAVMYDALFENDVNMYGTQTVASIIRFNQTYVLHCGIIDSAEEVVLCQIQ